MFYCPFLTGSVDLISAGFPLASWWHFGRREESLEDMLELILLECHLRSYGILWLSTEQHFYCAVSCTGIFHWHLPCRWLIRWTQARIELNAIFLKRKMVSSYRNKGIENNCGPTDLKRFHTVWLDQIFQSEQGYWREIIYKIPGIILLFFDIIRWSNSMYYSGISFLCFLLFSQISSADAFWGWTIFSISNVNSISCLQFFVLKKRILSTFSSPCREFSDFFLIP